MTANGNILVTTLGTSWQIVPEIVGWTNPDCYDFFKGNEEVTALRKKHDIKPVGQFWVVSTENQEVLDKLQHWAAHWGVEIKIFYCDGVDDLSSEEKIRTFRSFLFRVVLNASKIVTENRGRLYLSLTGGRKNMSADMFEAGTLFGCDGMFHIIDVKQGAHTGAPLLRCDAMFHKPTESQKDDALLSLPGKYAYHYLPVIVSEKMPSSFVVSAGEKRIVADDYPLTDIDLKKFHEDGTLEKEISRRKKQSLQIYSNFYERIRSAIGERDIFRQLYFLHPDTLNHIKHFTIGENPTHFNRDMALLKSLPKADLHTHLGGVLSADEIIEVAKVHPRPEKVSAILKFLGNSSAFDHHIFGAYIDPDKFYRIGIDAYQMLGNYQGSNLLQSKETIRKTIEIYAQKLIDDNVKYVEIRCSPYKYTKEGLSIDEVVNTIIETMNKQEKLFYGLIYIFDRKSDSVEIEERISELLDLIKRNDRFKNKLVGIDLAGDESLNRPKALRELFMPLLEACLHLTIHAGETMPVDSIWEAVYHLNADRIGHGLKLLQNKDFMRRFVDKNIGIELCPSSNRQIVGYGKANDEVYPLKEYMKRGLRVTVNTDNQGISRTSLSKEFYEAARLCGGLSLWDCFVLIRNSMIISFADKTTKMRLLQAYEKEIFDWCNRDFPGLINGYSVMSTKK